jgi:predicted transcriptional regulator
MRATVMTKKTNITLKLNADLLRSVKVLAAQRGTSVSALLAEKLEEIVMKEGEYERAMKRAIARMEKGSFGGWQKPKSRDELHER